MKAKQTKISIRRNMTPDYERESKRDADRASEPWTPKILKRITRNTELSPLVEEFIIHAHNATLGAAKRDELLDDMREIRDMAAQRSRVNMQNGVSLAAFARCSVAKAEAAQ